MPPDLITADDRNKLAFLSRSGWCGCVLVQGDKALLDILAVDTPDGPDRGRARFCR